VIGGSLFLPIPSQTLNGDDQHFWASPQIIIDLPSDSTMIALGVLPRLFHEGHFEMTDKKINHPSLLSMSRVFRRTLNIQRILGSLRELQKSNHPHQKADLSQTNESFEQSDPPSSLKRRSPTVRRLSLRFAQHCLPSAALFHLGHLGGLLLSPRSAR
jgi:hypothetical protein